MFFTALACATAVLTPKSPITSLLLPDVQGYKYVPFGPIEETMPYLIRRAQENSDMLGGVGKLCCCRCYVH
jgi:Proline dehydrogenase